MSDGPAENSPRTGRPRIAVVVPALDEARRLPAALASVRRQGEAAEVVVVDGGSTDGTPEIARAHGARVIAAPRGRAAQLNAGAAATSAPRLLFLHADTRLPDEAFTSIDQALAREQTVGGCFRLLFAEDQPDGFVARRLMRLWESRRWMTGLHFAFGDRAQFCRRSAFERVGGYPEQPLFEDLDFAAKLAGVGRFAFLDEAVVTSARRFSQHGALGQQLRNGALLTARRLGVSPATCKRFYRDGRR